ncbi:MAG TPA: MlaD family protein [Steroidobacteraceae bacterium]|nr:MlaD family protein [Steroidobacteraceae bacterium]
MSEAPEREVEARVRPRRWFAWVWIVPIVAAGIVLWLAWRGLADRGPMITISFKVAEGLEPGQTKIQHRDVDVGSVESVELTPDMSHVIVHARMTRRAAPYLNEKTRFYIVAPHVGVGGISGLSTIVSGTYIEMYPGRDGAPKRDFVALDEPPILPPDTPGTSYILQAPDLSSLTQGSPVSYHGVSVGEVEGYTLAPDGTHVTVTAFIRSPQDKLVHRETRFWNAGGVDASLGAQGVRVRANSWAQLLSGGIAFETPEPALAGTPSPAGTEFKLYDNRDRALSAPNGPELIYFADFEGDQRGVAPGIAVELQGNVVGDVKEAHLRYDEHRHRLVTRVTFAVDASRVNIDAMPRPAGTDPRLVVGDWLKTLVEHGLRAQISSISFLTGQKVVALDTLPNAHPAHVRQVGQSVEFPSTSSGDLTEILASLRSVLQNLDRATSGPQLQHALQSLDETLTHLDSLTHDVEPDIKSLIKSLRDTSEAAQNTLSAVQGMVGTNGNGNTDLPKMMRELSDAARSVRVLADYLDRHPESLLQGRKGDEK